MTMSYKIECVIIMYLKNTVTNETRTGYLKLFYVMSLAYLPHVLSFHSLAHSNCKCMLNALVHMSQESKNTEHKAIVRTVNLVGKTKETYKIEAESWISTFSCTKNNPIS